MIIQRINNVLVKHGKVTFGIFTAVIIVSFVWFFTPGRDGSMLFDRSAGANTAYGSVLGSLKQGLATHVGHLFRDDDDGHGDGHHRAECFECYQQH